MRKDIEMSEASFYTSLTYFNDNNGETSAYAKLLNREGREDENDGRSPKMEQGETPTIAKRKS